MNHLAKLILLVTCIPFVHLPPVARSTGDYELFTCTREFERNDPIKRFAVYGRDLYFFLEDKVLRYDDPSFHSHDGDYYLTSLQFNALNYRPGSKPSVLEKANQIGLIQTNFDEQPGFQSYVITKEDGEIEVVSLNFSLPSVGDLSSKNFVLAETIKPDSTFQFVQLDSTRRLEIAFNASKPNQSVLRIVHTQEKPKEKRFQHSNTMSFNFGISSVGYLHLSEHPVGKQLMSFKGNLVALGNQKIGIGHLEFDAKAPTNDLILDSGVQMTFEEFFNCRTPFREPRQVKGLFYSDGTFFVFIQDYYLIVKREKFARQGFLLRDVDYRSARAIERQKGTRFEWLSSKWVKALRNQTYLASSEEESNENAYVLSVKKTGSGGSELKITEEKWRHFPGISRCRRQTLQVGSRVFCFSKKVYYLFVDTNSTDVVTRTNKPISSMFQSTDVQFDEKLQFIFNHENDTFIMMAESEFFTLAYEQVHVDEQLNIRVKANTTVRRQKSCLFNVTRGNCPESDFTTPTSPTTERIGSESNDGSQTESDEDKKGLSKKQRMIIVAATLFTMCLILLVLCFCIGSKKPENGKGKSKVNLVRSRSNSNPETAYRGGSKLNSPSMSPPNSNADSFKSGSTINTSQSASQPEGGLKGSVQPLGAKSERGLKNNVKSVNARPENGVKSIVLSSKTKSGSKTSVTSTSSKRGSIQGVQASNSDSIHFKSELSRPTI